MAYMFEEQITNMGTFFVVWLCIVYNFKNQTDIQTSGQLDEDI
jgi:hypothetical protein